MKGFKSLVLTGCLLIPFSVSAQQIICRGSITSIQGEGLVARSHRFDLFDLAGTDVSDIIAKSVEIAREKQNRAAARNPGTPFRPFSDLDLQCLQGGQNIHIRRSVRTSR
jgi:hypothetical protein